MIIQISNNLHEFAPSTRTTYAEVAGTNVIRWENPNGFGASWAIQIGATGEEQTEVVILGASVPSGTAGTLTANTLYSHPADTPIYGIKYNQVIFEKSTLGTAGTATPITNGTVTYQADGTVTSFDDTSGASTHAYRTRFQYSGGSTSQSDWLTPAGFDFYSLGKMRQRSKNKLWNASWLTNDLLDEWLNECREKMVTKAIQVNEDYALGTVDVAFGTNGLGTITTADFNQLRRVWITYDGVNTYQSTKMNINDSLPNQIFSASHPYHTFRGDDVIQVFPADSQGTASLVFYRFGTTMVNDTDTLPLPMRPHSNIFVDYCYAQALGKDEKFKESKDKLEMVGTAMDEFVLSLAPRDKSGITMIDIVEPIGPQHPF